MWWQQKNLKKTLKFAKKSVDKREVVCYSNKADAAEAGSESSKSSPVYLEN